MKPFNIEEAKAHPERIVYLNGQKPQQVFFSDCANSRGKVITINKKGDVLNQFSDGSLLKSEESVFDLFLLEQPEEEIYIIIDNKSQWDGTFYTDLALAKRMELPFDTIYKLSKI